MDDGCAEGCLGIVMLLAIVFVLAYVASCGWQAAR